MGVHVVVLKGIDDRLKLRHLLDDAYDNKRLISDLYRSAYWIDILKQGSNGSVIEEHDFSVERVIRTDKASALDDYLAGCLEIIQIYPVEMSAVK